MKWDILVALFQNATLLLGLSVIYQITNFVESKYKNMEPVFNGLLVSLICIASMSMPFTFNSGIIFDTRSIIISVTALVFGPISAAITVIVAGIYRVIIGGVGVRAGLTTILSSALIGLAWRRWIYFKLTKWNWMSIYAMGIIVHLGLLASMLLLPYPNNMNVISEISIAIMLTYPIVTVLLSMLLIRQQAIRNMQDQLEESERSKSILLSNLPGLAYRCNNDLRWTMQFVSKGCFNLTGYNSDSLLYNRDLSYNDLIAPEHYVSLIDKWNLSLLNKQQFKFEYEIITSNGARKWVMEMGKGIYNKQGELEAVEGIILDISDKKQIELALRYISEHDSWTGLYNREYLEMLLERDANNEDGTKKAFIGINLIGVQILTARHGYHYTQNLIKVAAEALSKYSTDKHILCQTYGNRFLFYLKDYKDKSELIDFSEAIGKAMESVFQLDRISGGIGILKIEKNNKIDTDVLLKRLLIATERSINIFETDFRTYFYDEELEAMVNREGEIRQELARIADDNSNDELFLQYQPIMDLKTNSIIGFEALARLRTEKLGLVSPLEFIPIAEETKLINPIGEIIIINAFQFINRLKKYGYESTSVSINISAIQLLRHDFTDRLFEIIKDMNVNPINIGIEITESIFSIEYTDINNIIHRLRDAGLHIAIDDFGTGYSSLAREKELNVNCLKIDKYFIDKLLDTDPDKTITSDIISMAHKLGHYAIAEGVEYESQLEYLRKHDCDQIQGYLISKPLDEEAALEFLKTQQLMKVNIEYSTHTKEPCPACGSPPF